MGKAFLELAAVQMQQGINGDLLRQASTGAQQGSRVVDQFRIGYRTRFENARRRHNRHPLRENLGR
ncbi:hypothetical protein GCM10010096_22350 [Alcaligenes pakistanensis]|uniref:Uncharacterized protein n=1 Tax=Alcaligenes pakistanensis TaxID=1482717 RepID=A0A8H9M7Z8_9BURK|nr:hypothetical protein GCM10010096_22350 [Alcaligenes pakistanensis]